MQLQVVQIRVFALQNLTRGSAWQACLDILVCAMKLHYIYVRNYNNVEVEGSIPLLDSEFVVDN